jgi:hypothetical protein
VFYIYESFTTLEDERKHVLRPCGRPGGASGALLEISEVGSSSGSGMGRCLMSEVLVSVQVEVLRAFAQSLVRWLSDVLATRWWKDLFSPLPVHPDEEARVDDVITVHNRTLKEIKVCLYASDDFLCWIPLGGFSSGSVGLLPAEQSRPFSFARRSGDKVSSFRLKVFQPCFLDIELASCSDVSGGDSFEFYDAERMITRSRTLLQSPPRQGSKCKSRLQSPQREWKDSGCDDYCNSMVTTLPPVPPMPAFGKVESSGLSYRAAHPRATSAMVRQTSACELQSVSAGPDEASPSYDQIVLRNRSQQDIRALLFSVNDYCQWIPLVGKLTMFSDCILPDKEKWFNLNSVGAKEFTLKVYDVGEGNKVLTYLTVSRGHAYTFGTSLLQ